MIVFFDIGGTLITEDEKQTLPASTVAAITQMRENGHMAFVNTGRTLFNATMWPYMQKIPFDGFVCACGCDILIRDESATEQNEIPPRVDLETDDVIWLYDTVPFRRYINVTVPVELHALIVNAAREARMDLMLEGPDRFYFDFSRPLSHGADVLYTRDPGHCASVDDRDKCFNKFVTWENENSLPGQFVQAVSPWFDPLDRGNHFREFPLRGFSKASGIRAVCRILNVPIDECIVIGDSVNDEAMLKAVRHSVLMGNGTERLKPEVEFVTRNVEDDGIAYALRHYGLI